MIDAPPDMQPKAPVQVKKKKIPIVAANSRTKHVIERESTTVEELRA
jgi:hypothetical protein